MTVAELRQLPFVLHPLPDEPFDSWFNAMAAALRTTSGNLAESLGLRSPGRGIVTTAWSMRLSEWQLNNLERVTGMNADVFRASTREGFATNAVLYDRRGAISMMSPIAGASGRYCPECLRDSGGRWRMTWQFPFGFACVAHGRLLVDHCPACGEPPRRVALPQGVIPIPGSCQNPIGHHENGRVKRCGTDLCAADVDRATASAEVLTAQRFIMRALTSARTADGLWESGPQPTARVLGDLRLLARFAIHPRVDGNGPRQVRLLSGATSAADLAAGYSTAVQAVYNPPLITKMLRDNVTTNTAYEGLSPQMQSLIAATRGSTRRVALVLQTAFDCHDPVKRAAKLPALLWPDWTDLLAPKRTNRTGAAGGLSAAIAVTGTKLTRGAGLRLLDPDEAGHRLISLIRSFGAGRPEQETLSTIVRLAQYFEENETPIDYARRRSLSYGDLLPAEEWEQIAIAQNVHTGKPRRAVLARAYLHRLLSGDRAHRLQSRARPAATVTDADIDTYTRRTPVKVLGALNESGVQYLRRSGIQEPAMWQPDPRALGLGAFMEVDARDKRETWSPRRPVRGGPDSVEIHAVKSAHERGLSRRATAQTLGLSRQSVSRVLSAHGISTKPGRTQKFHIDQDWLREEYETKGRSASAIAAEVRCSQTTILRHLRMSDGDG